MKQNFSVEMNRLNRRVEDTETEMVDLEERHKYETKEKESELDRQKDLVHEEKQRRRRTEQNASDMKTDRNEHLNAMKVWLMNTQDELKVCILCYFALLFRRMIYKHHLYLICCSLYFPT